MNVLRSEYKAPGAVLTLTLVTEQPATPEQVVEFGRMVTTAESVLARLNEGNE